MDRISKNVSFHPSVMISNKYGVGDSVPIDQQAAKEFNYDLASGRPLSDITAVIRAQGLDKQRLLADMTEFKAEFLPDDISDADVLKYAVPRLTQLPSELAEYQAALTKARLEEEISKKEQEDLNKLREAFLKTDDDEPKS